ncbi:MAG: LpxD N-terminal domain-containing protein, partial [Pseudomonadota bacterium]|nr:LpxD N-terminal domain-containing protein [Pseudomonadota bacterium]
MGTSILTLGEIADHIDAQIAAGGRSAQQSANSAELAAIPMNGLGSLASAKAGQLSHLSSPTYKPLLSDCSATAIILRAEDLPECPGIGLVVERPYLAFAKASGLFVVPVSTPAGIHPTAVVHASAQIATTARIGAYTVIGADAVIEDDVTVHANVSVSDRVRLQRGVEVMSNVSIYADVGIGPRSSIHSGAVIGSPGFGFTPDQNGQLQTIAQLGGVSIGADVRVGAG